MKKIFLNKSNFLIGFCFAICVIIAITTACRKQEDTLVVNGPAPTPRLPIQVYSYYDFSSFGSSNTVTLGRVLFYDKNLSLNNAISCGSCHVQQHAFADNHQFSMGLNNGFTSRNASAIFSSPGHNKFWDGRADDYSTAVFMPVQNHLEMNIFSLNILPTKLAQLSYYPDLFEAAYGTSEINVARIRGALASFLGAMHSSNSKFDNASNSNQPLTAIEEKGLEIFNGKGKCYNCHSGDDFNNYTTSYENIGLETNYSDNGRGKITNDPGDNGKFIVPTLRNIALTAPYMHDGRYKTLREVIDHYSEGIQNHPNLSPIFRDISNAELTNVPDTFTTENSVTAFLSGYPVLNLNLSEDEKKALEAFLNTLTDVSFITDPKFSDPFHN